MSKRQAEILLSHIHRFMSTAAPESASDRDLLKRFLDHRDEAAATSRSSRCGKDKEVHRRLRQQ